MSRPSAIDGGFRALGWAVRHPEDLAVRWRDRVLGAARSPPGIFAALFALAAGGIAAHAVALGLHLAPQAMLISAAHAVLALALPWLATIPALYILNTWLGSNLDRSTTVLAALLPLGLGAGVLFTLAPVTAFLTLALPYPAACVLWNGVALALAALAAIHVLGRVMCALEPDRLRHVPVAWVNLVLILTAELLFLVGPF